MGHHPGHTFCKLASDGHNDLFAEGYLLDLKLVQYPVSAGCHGVPSFGVSCNYRHPQFLLVLYPQPQSKHLQEPAERRLERENAPAGHLLLLIMLYTDLYLVMGKERLFYSVSVPFLLP